MARPATYSDLHVVGVHEQHHLIVIENGTNAEGTDERRVLRAHDVPAPDEQG